jgi:hypothetical protein
VTDRSRKQAPMRPFDPVWTAPIGKGFLSAFCNAKPLATMPSAYQVPTRSSRTRGAVSIWVLLIRRSSRPMCGRPPHWQGFFERLLQRQAAGHNAIRVSGPDQKLSHSRCCVDMGSPDPAVQPAHPTLAAIAPPSQRHKCRLFSTVFDRARQRARGPAAVHGSGQTVTDVVPLLTPAALTA